MKYSQAQQINMEVEGGGTTNYEVLENKPQINGVTLSENKTPADLGLVKKNGDTVTGKLIINQANGTAGALGATYLEVGNNIPRKDDGNSYGRLRLWSSSAADAETNYRADIYASNLTANRNFTLPDRAGSIALTSDIKFVKSSNTAEVTIAANGTATVTLDSHTAPEGLTLRGMLGVYIGNSNCQIGYIYGLNSSGNAIAQIQVANKSSSSITLAENKVRVMLLYAR